MGDFGYESGVFFSFFSPVVMVKVGHLKMQSHLLTKTIKAVEKRYGIGTSRHCDQQTRPLEIIPCDRLSDLGFQRM